MEQFRQNDVDSVTAKNFSLDPNLNNSILQRKDKEDTEKHLIGSQATQGESGDLSIIEDTVIKDDRGNTKITIETILESLLEEHEESKSDDEMSRGMTDSQISSKGIVSQNTIHQTVNYFNNLSTREMLSSNVGKVVSFLKGSRKHNMCDSKDNSTNISHV